MSEQCETQTNAPGSANPVGDSVEAVLSVMEMDEPTTYGDVAAAATAFAELKIQEGDRKKQLETVKKKIAELEPQLLALFEQSGTANIKLSNGMTIYVRRQIWGGVVDGVAKDDLIAKLKADDDTNFLIKENYNAQTLAAWVRELEQNDEGEVIIPESLKGFLKATERISAAARKS